jgi:hypothetical protein
MKRKIVKMIALAFFALAIALGRGPASTSTGRQDSVSQHGSAGPVPDSGSKR